MAQVIWIGRKRGYLRKKVGSNKMAGKKTGETAWKK